MYEQFQHVMKLGPINRFMDMIPGLPKVVLLLVVVVVGVEPILRLAACVFLSPGIDEQRKWRRAHQALHVYDGQVHIDITIPPCTFSEAERRHARHQPKAFLASLNIHFPLLETRHQHHLLAHALCCSMTDDELDGRVTIGQSRLLRIGS